MKNLVTFQYSVQQKDAQQEVFIRSKNHHSPDIPSIWNMDKRVQAVHNTIHYVLEETMESSK
jgi:hypothetical protein